MIQYLLCGGLTMADFSSRLTEAIEIRGVTQKWLADEADTTEATISRYLNGKASPAILVILGNIAKALNVSSDFLIGITNLAQSKETISIEEKIILSVWKNISADDKRVLFALLDKYLTPNDKAMLAKGE